LTSVKASKFTDSTLDDLFEHIRAGEPEKSIKDALPLFCPGTFDGTKSEKGSPRINEAVQSIACLIGDHDASTMGLQDARQRLEAAGVAAVLYTTPRHTPERPRWRVIVPLKRPVVRARGVDLVKTYRKLCLHLDALLGGGVLAGESFKVAQSFYFGKVKGVVYETAESKGAPFNPKAKLLESPKAELHKVGDDVPDDALEASIMSGDNIHEAMNRLVARLLARNMDARQVKQYIMALGRASGRDAERIAALDGEVQRSIDGALSKGFSPGHNVVQLGERIKAKLSVVKTEQDEAETPEEDDGLVLDMVDSDDLLARHFDPPEYVIDGTIQLTPGAWLLAGKPKQGKTWLAMNLACAVGTGTEYCDSVCSDRNARALYIALDDTSKERFQRRLKEMLPSGVAHRLTTIFALGSKYASSLDLLSGVIEQRPEIRFIVIDTLSAFRQKTRSDNPYQQEYDELQAINNWAHKHKVVVVVVHHLRKGNIETDNPFESISGTLGLQGGVDGMIVLHRKDDTSEVDEALSEKLGAIWFKGRDVEETGFGARLADGRWTKYGSVADVFQAGTKREIINVMKTEPARWWTSKEVHAAGDFSCKAEGVQRAMGRMVKKGELEGHRGALPGKSGGGGGFRLPQGAVVTDTGALPPAAINAIAVSLVGVGGERVSKRVLRDTLMLEHGVSRDKIDAALAEVAAALNLRDDGDSFIVFKDVI
jgi:hypothetical protein